MHGPGRLQWPVEDNAFGIRNQDFTRHDGFTDSRSLLKEKKKKKRQSVSVSGFTCLELFGGSFQKRERHSYILL